MPISYDAIHAETPVVHGPHVMFICVRWQEGYSLWKGTCPGKNFEGTLPEWTVLPDSKQYKQPLCELLSPEFKIPERLDVPGIVCTVTEYPSTHKPIVFVQDMAYNFAKQNSDFIRFLSPLLDMHPLLQQNYDIVIIAIIVGLLTIIILLYEFSRSKIWAS